MERTGIEPVTSGLQSVSGASPPSPLVPGILQIGRFCLMLDQFLPHPSPAGLPRTCQRFSCRAELPRGFRLLRATRKEASAFSTL